MDAVECNGYASGMQNIPANGTFSKIQADIYQCVLNAHTEVIESI